ncbi:MAG: hypothetical protein F4041_03690 [Acidobacteriia bacterium]|nr:hypothetical protein [Terriglobia bacterium]
MIAGRVCVNGVMDVDESLGIHLDTVAVSIADARRKVAPVVVYLVSPVGGFDDWQGWHVH